MNANLDPSVGFSVLKYVKPIVILLYVFQLMVGQKLNVVLILIGLRRTWAWHPGFTKEGINTLNCEAPPGCIRAQKNSGPFVQDR